MIRRLPSLFLLLVLFGNAFAGVPLHFGESECGMSGMMDMDCCQAALLQEKTSKVADAKLCCALNCAQNGTTSPPGSVRVTPPEPAALLLSPPVARAFRTSLIQSRRFDRLHGPPGSTPPYLRNLVLLI
jgi:hypothetical protein